MGKNSQNGLSAGEKKTLKAKQNGTFYEVWKRLNKNKLAMFGIYFLIFISLLAIFAGVICPEGYDNQDLYSKLIAPCKEYPFGTDVLGRSMLARILYGARYSLGIGVLAILVTTVGGLVLGSVAGYYGGRVDNVIMRFLDVFMAVPSLLLSIVIASVMDAGLVCLVLAISISPIPSHARMARVLVMTERDKEYVEAARATNASGLRIYFKYILPNIMGPLLVQFTMGLGSSIIGASMLSFIGVGAQPPIPEWGALLSEGRNYIRDYGYLITVPGCVIALTVFSIYMLGDGLRDALDPRLRGGK